MDNQTKPTIDDIAKLTDKLLIMREQANLAYEKYKGIAATRDATQELLLVMFKQSELKTITRTSVRVTLAERNSLAIIDEQKLISWLKKEKLANEYVETRVNKLFKLSAAPALAKEGKVPTGTELVKTEYISIASGKKNKN